MEAFKVSTHLSNLLDNYPEAKHIAHAAANGGRESREAIARLWMSEGIPFAFKGQPALYESVRAWLGIRLTVDPKEISLTGSARIGQSLAPKKLGTAFNETSDLDLFVVSTDLFERMCNDFTKWRDDFRSGVTNPSNDRERGFWDENKERGQKIINRGFLDSKMIPNRKAYETARNIANTMYYLKEKLAITENAPQFTHASIRCYKDWKSYVIQMVLSLS